MTWAVHRGMAGNAGVTIDMGLEPERWVGDQFREKVPTMVTKFGYKSSKIARRSWSNKIELTATLTRSILSPGCQGWRRGRRALTNLRSARPEEVPSEEETGQITRHQQADIGFDNLSSAKPLVKDDHEGDVEPEDRKADNVGREDLGRVGSEVP